MPEMIGRCPEGQKYDFREDVKTVFAAEIAEMPYFKLYILNEVDLSEEEIKKHKTDILQSGTEQDIYSIIGRCLIERAGIELDWNIRKQEVFLGREKFIFDQAPTNKEEIEQSWKDRAAEIDELAA